MKKIIESSDVHEDTIVIVEEILTDGSEVYDVEIRGSNGKGMTIMAFGETHAREIFNILVASSGVNIW